MFCSKCGKEINNDVVFCNYCGSKVNENPINTQVETINQPESIQNDIITGKSISNKSNNKLFIIIGICLVVVILFFIFFKMNNSSQDKDGNSESSNFIMVIDEVKATDGGVVVLGKIENELIYESNKVQMINKKHKVITGTIVDIRNQDTDSSIIFVGDYVYITLKGIKKEEVVVGQVITGNNAFKESKEFLGNVEILTRDKGGRNTPFKNDYKPQISFGFNNINSTISFVNGTEMVYPGDSVDIKFNLKKSEYMAVGSKFKLYENGKVVGLGSVKEIYK